MGLRSKIKNKVKKAIDSFSGEYSEEAPEKVTPYETPTGDQKNQEEVEVVMARLNRPGGSQ